MARRTAGPAAARGVEMRLLLLLVVRCYGGVWMSEASEWESLGSQQSMDHTRG